MHTFPDKGFLRLPQIIGQPAVSSEEAQRNRAAGLPNRRRRAATPALIPVSKSTWWAGIRSGRFPTPVKLGRSTLWRAEDIHGLLAQLACGDAGANI
jgi:predicted DNA-binding transcriptional regulator AlpA